MPNYDLGTAHGRIKIDADTRGAKDTEAALADLQAEVKGLKSDLADLTGGFDDYEAGTHKASKASKLLDQDFRRLVPQILQVKRALDLAVPAFRSLHNTTDGFKNNVGLTNILAAAPKLLLLNAITRKATNSFLGMGKAIDSLSPRSKGILQLARNVSVFAAGYATIRRFGPALADVAGKFSVVEKASGLARRAYAEFAGVALGGGGPKAAKAAGGLLSFAKAVTTVGKNVDSIIPNFGKLASGISGVLIGGALFRKGIGDILKPFALLNKIPAKFKLIGAAGLVALKPIAEIGAKGLVGISNLIAGLTQGVTQLAGGVLIVPGAIASVVAGMTTAKVLAGGLKKAFELVGTAGTGVFDTSQNMDDFNAALENVPPNLRDTAKALVGVKKETELLQKSLVDTFIQGGVEDAQVLGDILKGPVTKSMKSVTKELTNTRGKLVDFLGESDTLTKMNSIFSSTRGTIKNVTDALVPAGKGFITLAAQGANFVKTLSGGASGLAEKFNSFIQTNSDNGNITKWMQNAVKGAKDLVRGLVDVGRTLGTLLTVFKTGSSNDNFLDKFAKSAKKLNDATQKSAASGFIRDIADSTRQLGTDKLERFVKLIKDFYSLRKAFSGVFDTLSEAAFSGLDVAVQLLKVMLPILQGVIQAFTFLTPAVGVILGIAAAFKILLVALAPIRGAIVAITGAMAALYGGTKLIAFLAILEKLGPVGRAAASGILALATSALAVTAGFAAIALIVGGFFLAVRQGQKDLDASKAAFDQSAKSVSVFGDALHKAFTDDGGLAGKSVFTAVEDAVKNMNANLQNEINNTPGILAGMTDSLNAKNASVNDPNKTGSQRAAAVAALRVGAGPEHSDQFDVLKKAGEDAGKAKAAFDKLGTSTQDLASIIQGSQTDFDNYNTLLKASGEGGTEAAAQLDALRGKYVETQTDFAKAGPGAAQLSAALSQIGDAGADTTTKLQALKQALAALGLDQTSAIQNAFDYAAAIQKIGDEASSLVDQSAGLDKIFGPDGAINTADGGQNALNLFNAVTEAVTGFQRAVLDGKDVGAEFQKIQDQVPKLAAAFTAAGGDVDATAANIQNLIRITGGVPDVVSILVNVKGGDKVAADLAGIAAKLASQAQGTEIILPFTADPAQLQSALDAALGAGVASVGANNITIPAGIELDPAKKQAFFDSLIKNGIPVQAPGSPPPANPLPIATEAAPPAAPLPGDRGDGKVAQPPPAGSVAPAPAVAPDTSALDAMSAKYAELQQKFADLQANPPKIEVDASALADTSAKIDAALASFQKFTEGVRTSMAEAQAIIQATAANLITPLTAAASAAFTAGVSIGNSLAQGITSTIGSVTSAATALAATVHAFLPHSPAKKGPLSGKGYPLYSGIAVGSSFAKGIVNSTGGVANASGGMAGAVAGALNTYSGGNNSGGPGQKAGAILGQLSTLLDFGQHMVDAVSKIGKSILGFAKFMSDPLGKGSFFGQSAGAAFGFRRDPNVTDAELQAKQDEALQNKIQSPTKALTPEEQIKADQAKADAEAQAAVTSAAIDEVVAGKRVAPLSEAEKTAAKDATKAANAGKTKAEKAAASTAKTPDQLAATARQSAADLSSQLDALTPEQLAKVTSGEVSVKTQEQMLDELKKQTPLLGEAIDVSKKDTPGQAESIKALTTIQSLMDKQGEAKTPAQKQQMSALEGISSTIKGKTGLTEGANPIDQASTVLDAASGIAGDIFGAIQSWIEAVGATKNIADTLIRGVSNTEQVSGLIDDFQKYIQFAADVAGAVGSIASAASAFTGGADMGATAAVGQVASLISGALEAINASIDLAQEAYHIAGSYVGQFLGYLTGGSGSQLEGDVKFLLDTQTNQLLTYGTNNPQDKRVHDGIGGAQNTDSRNQGIGTINVYGGPGSDPRDNTRQMMYQVRAAQFAGATSG